MATPATAYDHLDPSIKRYVDMAEAVGWQIKSSARAVGVISPDGARISLPLKPTEDLLKIAEAQAQNSGLYAAFEARERELADAELERELAGLPDEPEAAPAAIVEPEPEEAPKAEDGEEPQEFPCPECGQPCASLAGLGRHRSSAHGVKGVGSAKLAKIDPERLGDLQTSFDLFEHELVKTLRALATQSGGNPERERELEQEAEQATRAAEKADRAAEKAARDLQAAKDQVRELKADLRKAEKFRAGVRKALHENTPLALAGAIAALDPEFFAG